MSKKITLKYLMYLLFLVVTGTTVRAQNVTIGTGTTNTLNAPIYGCGTYSFSEMIFSAAEIIAANGGVTPAGTVINLRFHYSSATNTTTTSNSDSWTIWMANSPQTTFTGTAQANWVPLTTANQVFDGTVIFPATDNWMTIPLQVPFTWNGVDNIVVAVADNNSGSFDCDMFWDATTTPAYETMYYNNLWGSSVDITALPNASGRMYTRPNVQLQWAVPCNVGTGYPTTGTVAVTPNAVCVTGNVSMSFTPATAMPSVTGITYKWQSGPTATGTFTDIPNSTSPNPYFTTTTPISTTTYFKCVVMCGSTPLFSSAASSGVTITNPGTVSGTGAARCGPGSVSLSATATNSANTLTWYASAIGGNPLGTGATFATPYNPTTTTYYVDGESNGTPVTVTNGSGTIMNMLWDFPTPFGNDYTASHDQYLILASELYASGFTPGKFTSLAFNLGAAYPSDPLDFYQIQMANTSETSLSTNGLITTGFTTVLPAATYTPPSATGWATTPFTTPFIWDGISNVVIDVSFSNAGPSCAFNNNWNGSGQVYQTATSFESSHSYFDNSNCTVNTMNPQVSQFNNETFFQRPNMQFGFTPICASPRVAVVATVNASPAISIAKPDVVCSDEIQSIAATTTPTTNYTNYSWTANPVDLYNDVAATTAYTNGNTPTVYVKSDAVGPHTFYLFSSGATAAACTHADTINVWVQPASVTIDGAPDSVCVSGTTTMTLNPATGYAPNSIQWQESADGVTYNSITGANSESYTTATLNAEHYYRAYVKSTHDTCQAPIKHIVVSNPVLNSTADSFACGSGTVTLHATSEGNSTIKWYATPQNGDALATGGTYVTPYLGATQTYYAAAEGGYSVPTEHQSGFDNTTTGGSSWNVGPFSVVDQSTVLQYLYTAADIAASGGTAGIISTFALNCTDVPLSAIPNFKIQMKTVPSSMTTLVWQTNMTDVYSNPSLTIPSGGWITFPLSQGISWNGIDNIVVQVCRDPVPLTSTSGDHEYTYNSDRMLYTWVYTGLSSCSATGTNSSGEVPNAKFGIRTVCTSPRMPVTAYVRPKPIVDLGPDKNVCVDSGTAVILDAGVQPNSPQYLWSTGSTSQVAAITANAQYWAQVTNSYTCVGSDTINVTLRYNPVADLGADTTVCNGAVLPLDPGPGSIQYYWSTGQTGEVINVTNPGTYNVFVINEAGCSDADTITVNMQGQLPTIQGIQITNDAQYTFHFEPINPTNVIGYEWNFGDGSAPSYVMAPDHLYDSIGNYTVVLRLSSTCGFVEDTASAHIVGIHQINVSNDELSVFPNPTTSTATIVIKGDLEMQKVEIYNVLGQVVYKKDADSKIKHILNLGALTSGLYTIQVYTDKGTVSRKLEVLK